MDLKALREGVGDLGRGGAGDTGRPKCKAAGLC